MLLCLNCSGAHRGLGVHLSFIRSLMLDHWTEDQIRRVILAGGNEKFNSFVELRNYINRESTAINKVPESMRYSKYMSSKAYLYRLRLDTKMEGRDSEVPNVLSNKDVIEYNNLVKLDSFDSPGASNANGASPSHGSNVEAGKHSKNVRWQPDFSRTSCSICQQGFTILFRRHHCRKCGKLVCANCAPPKNSKPIPSLGYKAPVRHCKHCYRSPLVRWTGL